jgi:hypothetical protein
MREITAARAALRAARAALEENSRQEEAAGIDYETETYLDLNDAVLAAELAVPPWRDRLTEIRDRLRDRREGVPHA